MAWPHYQNPVTVVDVLDTGACPDGVFEWLLKHKRLISGDPAKYRDDEYIQKAANTNGSGDGYGYG